MDIKVLLIMGKRTFIFSLKLQLYLIESWNLNLIKLAQGKIKFNDKIKFSLFFQFIFTSD
jgi:hypothetical protein